jgi:hypothetical protein
MRSLYILDFDPVQEIIRSGCVVICHNLTQLFV